MLCTECHAAHLVPCLRNEEFDYETEEGTVRVKVENVPVEVCPSCNEGCSGPEAGRVRTEAIRRALGLLTGDQIRDMRAQLGLTQVELAKVTGIDEVSISRWERGQLIQSRGFDRYLRLLTAYPENHAFLAALPNGAPRLAEATTPQIIG